MPNITTNHAITYTNNVLILRFTLQSDFCLTSQCNSSRGTLIAPSRALFMSGFLLSRDFFLRTHVNFACANRIEAMCERSRGNVKVAFSRETLYNASLCYLPA